MNNIRKCNYKTIEFNTKTSLDSGKLSFFEYQKDIDFIIKRIYFIYDVKAGSIRGYHAHKKLIQVLFCPFGAVRITLKCIDDEITITLDKPNKGLILEPCVWREIEWLIDNSVLCVGVSDQYLEDDYIRDFKQYVDYIKENTK